MAVCSKVKLQLFLPSNHATWQSSATWLILPSSYCLGAAYLSTCIKLHRQCRTHNGSNTPGTSQATHRAEFGSSQCKIIWSFVSENQIAVLPCTMCAPQSGPCLALCRVTSLLLAASAHIWPSVPTVWSKPWFCYFARRNVTSCCWCLSPWPAWRAHSLE